VRKRFREMRGEYLMRFFKCAAYHSGMGIVFRTQTAR
jgi:hypothetical protein